MALENSECSGYLSMSSQATDTDEVDEVPNEIRWNKWTITNDNLSRVPVKQGDVIPDNVWEIKLPQNDVNHLTSMIARINKNYTHIPKRKVPPNVVLEGLMRSRKEGDRMREATIGIVHNTGFETWRDRLYPNEEVVWKSHALKEFYLEPEFLENQQNEFCQSKFQETTFHNAKRWIQRNMLGTKVELETKSILRENSQLSPPHSPVKELFVWKRCQPIMNGQASKVQGIIMYECNATELKTRTTEEAKVPRSELTQMTFEPTTMENEQSQPMYRSTLIRIPRQSAHDYLCEFFKQDTRTNDSLAP